MLPTPSTSHVSYDLIYEPAEDSYLFLDTLSSASETAWLRLRFCSSSPPCSSSSSSAQPEPEPEPEQPTTSSSSRTRTRTTAQANNKSPPPLLVEVGPGSGVVVAFLAAHAPAIFGRPVLGLSVDVNPYACRATRTTVEKALGETQAAAAAEMTTTTLTTTTTIDEKNPWSRSRSRSIYLASLNGDLVTPLRSGEVDVLVFNPPYVPTESVPAPPAPPPPRTTTTPPAASPTFADQSHLLALSYAGGRDGMDVTRRLLRQVPAVLSPRGVAYVLFCRGNRPDEVKRWIRSWGSGSESESESEANDGDGDHHHHHQQGRWRAETVGTSGKTAGWEKLEIVRIWREEENGNESVSE
ncbi:hypothetical protein AYL99_07528 [Fonsecaea erecta]|uniref:Methyltransferase small domain-containing protein n=1 Tax=Fonsecaea erecta TaxID=1367422 RepID=A0A178ZF99_9EURO|nr:hypothetical protein AYL99_07528 [Fonsecaea erecta]OAP58438.1 hypothetical protein AYL99_07528 [Fonsecaea erecta]